MFDDDQQTPNTLAATFEFNEGGKKKLLVFEVRHWMSNHEAGIGERKEYKDSNTIGNLFYGSKGYMAVDSYSSYKTWLGREGAPGPAKSEGGDHFLNFIEAVRSRKRDSLNAEIEEGASSTILVHLANISYKVGRTLHFDSKTMSVTGDAEANKLFSKVYRKGFAVPEKV